MRKSTRNIDLALLGKTEEGDKVYLERGSFDCDWYFGFGNIHIYEENKQEPSALLHWDSFFTGSKHVTPEKIDDTLFDSVEGKLAETPFTKKELWQLCDLMKTFYALKEASGVYEREGSSHLTGDTRGLLKNEDLKEELNEDTAHIIREVQKLVGLDKPEVIGSWVEAEE